MIRTDCSGAFFLLATAILSIKIYYIKNKKFNKKENKTWRT
jgi:hypothetical protein